MKPTLNEEIGMSKQGIDYVNSLEVVSEDVLKNAPEGWQDAMENNISEYMAEIENQRIKRQGKNALICVLIIIALTFITNYFNK